MPEVGAEGSAPPEHAILTDQLACFGYEVRSPLVFRYMRAGSGVELQVLTTPQTEIPALDHPILEWRSTRSAREVWARLYREETYYRLWTASGGWITIEPDVPRVILPDLDDPALAEEHLWSIPVALCLLHRGDLLFHAAAVEVDGGAILLLGPGASGKTTLAAAFARQGDRVLSEDIACIRFEDAPVVIPGPAMLRVRSDVLPYLHVPHATVIRSTSSSTSLALGGPLRGTCSPVALRAAVLLEMSPEEFATNRLDVVDAIAVLWRQAFCLPGDATRARCFAQVGSLAQRVPLWTLARPLRPADLTATVELIRSTCVR